MSLLWLDDKMTNLQATEALDDNVKVNVEVHSLVTLLGTRVQSNTATVILQ